MPTKSDTVAQRRAVECCVDTVALRSATFRATASEELPARYIIVSHLGELSSIIYTRQVTRATHHI